MRKPLKYNSLIKATGIILVVFICTLTLSSAKSNTLDSSKLSTFHILNKLTEGYYPDAFFCSDNVLVRFEIKDEKLLLFERDGYDCTRSYGREIYGFYNSDSTIVDLLLYLLSEKSSDDTLLHKCFNKFGEDTHYYSTASAGKNNSLTGITVSNKQTTALIFLYNFLAVTYPSALQVPLKKVEGGYCLYIFAPNETTDWVSKNRGNAQYMRERFKKSPPKFTFVFVKYS